MCYTGSSGHSYRRKLRLKYISICWILHLDATETIFLVLWSSVCSGSQVQVLYLYINILHYGFPNWQYFVPHHYHIISKMSSSQ
jgi:hypothetical protein